MNLNDIFQAKSEKLAAFLEAFVIDKAGNIYIDADRVMLVSTYHEQIIQGINELESSLSGLGDSLSAVSSMIDPVELSGLIDFFTTEEERLSEAREQEVQFETISSTWADGDPEYVKEEEYSSDPGETPLDVIDAAPPPSSGEEEEEEPNVAPSTPDASDEPYGDSDLTQRANKPMTIKEIDDVLFDVGWKKIDEYKSVAKAAINATYDCAKKGLRLGYQSKKVIDDFTKKYEKFLKHDTEEPFPPRLPQGFNQSKYKCCDLFVDVAKAHKKYCAELDGLTEYFAKIDNDPVYADLTPACKLAYVAGIYYGLVDWKLGRLEYAAKRIVLWFSKFVTNTAITFAKTIRAFGSLFSDEWSKEGIKQNLKNMIISSSDESATEMYQDAVDTAISGGMTKEDLKSSFEAALKIFLDPIIRNLFDMGIAQLLEDYGPDADMCKTLVLQLQDKELSYKQKTKDHHAWCHGQRIHLDQKVTAIGGRYEFYQDSDLDRIYAPDEEYSETTTVYGWYDMDDELCIEKSRDVVTTPIPTFPKAYESIVDPDSGVEIPVKSAKWVCVQDSTEYTPESQIPTSYVSAAGDSDYPPWKFYLEVEFDEGDA